MPEEKELVCVNCPKGCRIIVTMEDKKILSIKGYSCENGKQYAEEEMNNCQNQWCTTQSIACNE